MKTKPTQDKVERGLVAVVNDRAVNALRHWVDGWTDPDPTSGEQYRVQVIAWGNDWVDVSCCVTPDWDGHDEAFRYRISLSVEEKR